MGTKTTALTELTTDAVGTDIMQIVDDPGGTPASKKIQVSRVRGEEVIILDVSRDETTALTVADDKLFFRMPFAFTLNAGIEGVRASVATAPTGSTIIIDIEESGTTILSTLLTIDATEKTSYTAVAPVVISDTALAKDAEIGINIDQIGSSVAGAGLKVYLIGHKV